MSLNGPCRTGAFALAAYAAAIAMILSARGWDVSSLITAGDAYVDRETVPGAIPVLPRSTGYDGQFFYRIALDPFASEQTSLGITLDRPAYRHRRILYPLLARFLALGNASWIPSMLLCVNWLAAGALAAIGGALAQQLGRSAGWGLLFAFHPGFLLSLTRDLAEIVAAVFVLGGMLALLQRRDGVAAGAWLFASLARETTLALPLAALVVRLAAVRWKNPQAPGWRVALVPLLGNLAWTACVSLHWNQPATPGRSFAGLPLFGVADGIAKLAASSPFDWVWAAELVVVACFTIAVARKIRSGPLGYAEIGWLAYAMLGVTAQAKFWSEDWAFLRVLAEFHVIGSALLLSSQAGPPTAVFALVVWAWLARLGGLA